MILPFPLYHGTSTIWRESIIEHGLGGHDVLKELQALAFYNQCRVHLQSIPADKLAADLHPYLIDLIATQRVTAAGFNFRHGGTYLTPSRNTAERYANRYGSELLQECKRVYDVILHAENGQTPEWARQFDALLCVLMQAGKRLLVRIDDVNLHELEAEDGTDALIHISPLLDMIAERERAVENCAQLRRQALAGNDDALVQLASLRLTETSFLDPLSSIGQQTNFRATVVFSVRRLHLDELSD